MKRLTLIFLPLLIVLLLGCGQPPAETEPPAAAETAVAATPLPPRPAQNNVTILADGAVQAVQAAVPLSFETGGTLLALNVQAGDDVQAGDLIATLDGTALQEAVVNTELQVAQAQNSLAQAQLDLDNLLTWEPDAQAVAQAESSIAAAEVALANAEAADAAAGNSVTQALVSVNQAQRSLADAQEAYDTAFDPGREWELNSPFYADRLKAERETATNALQFAQEQLQVAQANYALATAGVNSETAVSAESNLVAAQASLAQAVKGPTAAEIDAAELRVQQAEISLAQAELALAQAQANLAQAELTVPLAGTVLSADAAPGTLVSPGTPIVTVWDTSRLEFHTTNVSERDLAQIVPGQVVEITLKSYPSRPIMGTVLRIGLQSTGTVGDSAVFPVIIGLETADLDVLPGMTGRAEIVRAEE